MQKSILSLKFSQQSSRRGVQTKIIFSDEDSIRKSLDAAERSIYVIEKPDLQSLLKFKDLFFDKGYQEKSRDLSRYLFHYKRKPHLSHNKIFLLEASYSQPGKVCSGINSFIKKAKKPSSTKWARITIIYVRKDVFLKLLEQAPQEIEKVNLASDPHFSEPSIFDDIKRRNEISDESIEGLKKYFLGDSPDAQRVRLEILVASKNELPVLILGETGCGKNVIAETIHQNSRRAQKAFITINCGAIVSTLFESEIFGWKKGAHNAATENRAGMIMAANHGTLFFDEIGDLPLDQQVKLLDFLERGKIRPLGEDRNKDVNLRVIAATNRDLHAMVQYGQFRSDLLFRLLQSSLIMAPSLRDHIEDIAVLSTYLWKKKIVNDTNSNLPDDIIHELQNYRWPGNVRELKSILSGLFSYFGKDNLSVNHLSFIFQMRGQMELRRRTDLAIMDGETSQANSLRHLKKTEQCLRSIKVLLEPFIQETVVSTHLKNTMSTSMVPRIKELGELLKQPMLLFDETTFSTINQLKGSLVYYCDLFRSYQFEKSNKKKIQTKLQMLLTSSLDKISDAIGEIVHILADPKMY